MLSTGWPNCCLCIISDSANTEHRPAILTGLSHFRASAPKSSMGMPSLAAWWSKKEPVPAAQTVFMAKSTTIPSRSIIILESCPPISIMVFTSGIMLEAAIAWAVISFLTTSAPTTTDATSRPLPVTPTPQISTPSARSPFIFFKHSCTVSIGLPAVLV